MPPSVRTPSFLFGGPMTSAWSATSEFAQVVYGAAYGAMECFSMQVSDVVTSANGSPVVQPPDLSTWAAWCHPGPTLS